MDKKIEVTYEMLALGNKRFANFVIDTILVTICQFGAAALGNWLYDTYGNEGFLVGSPDMGNIKYTLLALGITIVY